LKGTKVFKNLSEFTAGFMIEGVSFEGGVVYYTGKSRPKFLFPDLGGRIRSKEYSIELVDNLSEAIQNSGVEYDENIITSHADSNDESCVIDKQTSVELGVIRSERIPDLISTLTELPRGRISNHFRELLSNPPPEKCRKIIRNIVSEFLRNEEGLEETVVLDEERIVRCLRSEETPTIMFLQILKSLRRGKLWLDWFEDPAIAEYVSWNVGRKVSLDELIKGGKRLEEIIERVIHDPDDDKFIVDNDRYGETDEQIYWVHPHSEDADKFGKDFSFKLNNYLNRNEKIYNNRIKQSTSPKINKIFNLASTSRNAVIKAVETDLLNIDKKGEIDNKFLKNVIFDVFNNDVYFRNKPEDWEEKEYVQVIDRNGKRLPRYTTENLRKKISTYKEVTQDCRSEVSKELKKLARDVMASERGHESLVDYLRVNLIFKSLEEHVRCSKSKNWTLLDDIDAQNPTSLKLNNFRPYWDETFVPNNIEISANDIVLLTAPNMSGKSTVMRAVTNIILLNMCGLLTPTSSGSAPSYSSIFFRGASSDVPVLGRSGFGNEMEDVKNMFEICDDKSWVVFDELGRGTSPKDGTAVGAAVMEKMAKDGIGGIFSTHLFGIVDIAKSFEGVVNMRMKSKVNELNEVEWCYELEEGVCDDSMAIATARRFGLPEEVVNRAIEFGKLVTQDGKVGDADLPGLNTASTSTATVDLPTAKKILSKHAPNSPTCIDINAAMLPPPSLEGRSCVYVLKIPPKSGDGNFSKYYVGETESINQRLKQHRSKRAKGYQYSKVQAAVVGIEGGKSKARLTETKVMKELEGLGFDLISKGDIDNKKFSSS
ncbi:hypothetical protein TL16_g10248, partial [Triparma laevis f. inornata]